MRSDKPVICPDCGDTHYRTESCPPNPTPKPTAEERAEMLETEEGLSELEARSYRAGRRQAFEQAAEIGIRDATPSVMFDSRYRDGWQAAMTYYKAAILALAKE